MIVLRIFIQNEDLTDNPWQLIDGSQVVDSGQGSLRVIMELDFEQLEVYLAPHLSTIIKIDLGSISDRKINDELLLGFAEDNLAEDIDTCKPILMRLTDGEAYVAILNRSFYTLLLEHFSENIKQVKFIQPFPFAIDFEEEVWTIYLIGEDKFVRTSRYEFFLLDDNLPLPVILEQMLANYTNEKIMIYSEDQTLIDIISEKYNLSCVVPPSINYGVIHWNFYNEKSKRFNFKLNQESKGSLLRTAKVASIFIIVYLIYWILNLGSLLIEKTKLQNQVAKDLQGIITVDKFTPNLLDQVDSRMNNIYHAKGMYNNSDFVTLFEVFLKSMPNVDNSMIAGSKYSGNQLMIFLNSKFNQSQFYNYRSILMLKRVDATLTDYKTYQASEDNTSKKNNNGGGILDNSNGSAANSPQMSDVAWVVTLQTISRMDELDDSANKKIN